jgi:hypothetical protein
LDRSTELVSGDSKTDYGFEIIEIIEIHHHGWTNLKKLTPGAKKIRKTVLKTKLKTKETTYTLVFVKFLVVSF